MPDSVRKSLSDVYHFYLDMAEQGGHGPSAKELRMRSALSSIMNDEEQDLT